MTEDGYAKRKQNEGCVPSRTTLQSTVSPCPHGSPLKLLSYFLLTFHAALLRIFYLCGFCLSQQNIRKKLFSLLFQTKTKHLERELAVDVSGNLSNK